MVSGRPFPGVSVERRPWGRARGVWVRGAPGCPVGGGLASLPHYTARGAGGSFLLPRASRRSNLGTVQGGADPAVATTALERASLPTAARLAVSVPIEIAGVRLLLVSDLHYSLPQLDWIVEAAAEFDLVVVAGDSLNIASPVSLDAQTVVIVRYLSMLQSITRVSVSSGNHDLTGPDIQGEQTALWLNDVRSRGIPTDGESVLLEDTLVTICPWWDGPAGQEALSTQLRSAAAHRPRTWVWVYHWPPLGSPTCWTGRRDYGDTELRTWIDQHRPDIVLTGHVHEAPFKSDGSWADRIGDTWVFNAGHQIGPVPARIELDLNAGTATWLSLLGIEALDLNARAVPERTVF